MTGGLIGALVGWGAVVGACVGVACAQADSSMDRHTKMDIQASQRCEVLTGFTGSSLLI